MVGVFVAFIRVVYGRMIYMSLSVTTDPIRINIVHDSSSTGQFTDTVF